eukprot:Skav231020  [mRNA]  locus=scaffold1869:37158:45424:+ [translate_table: standard]
MHRCSFAPRYSVKLDNITVTAEDFVAVKEELREKFSKFGDIGDAAVKSISCLETGDIVLCSKSSIWVFPSHFCGQAALPQVECEATCILALGSQTVAAGDHAGRVRAWHLRRQTLKEVRNVHVHFSAIRAISSGGDILLTASDDGSVKQLDVLANFVPSDFFTTGVLAHRCYDSVGGDFLTAGSTGARVLAVGHGRVAVWLDPSEPLAEVPSQLSIHDPPMSTEANED